MKETKKQIVEQTRQRVAAEYKKVIAAKDGVIDRLRNEIHLLQVKVDHQADHITQLTETLHLFRGESACKAKSPDTESRAYTVSRYETDWPDSTNIVLMLHPLGDPLQTVGIIEAHCRKTGERQGEAYLWNLYVESQHRRHGCAHLLLQTAEQEALRHQCHTASLEWELRESPRWVLDFYTRQGYAEREFGKDSAWLAKKL